MTVEEAGVARAVDNDEASFCITHTTARRDDFNLLNRDDFTSRTFSPRPLEPPEPHSTLPRLCLQIDVRFSLVMCVRPLLRSRAPLQHASRKYSIVHVARCFLVLHCDYSVCE